MLDWWHHKLHWRLSRGGGAHLFGWRRRKRTDFPESYAVFWWGCPCYWKMRWGEPAQTRDGLFEPDATIFLSRSWQVGPLQLMWMSRRAAFIGVSTDVWLQWSLMGVARAAPDPVEWSKNDPDHRP
jgi:hypothetical protein